MLEIEEIPKMQDRKNRKAISRSSAK